MATAASDTQWKVKSSPAKAWRTAMTQWASNCGRQVQDVLQCLPNVTTHAPGAVCLLLRQGLNSNECDELESLVARTWPALEEQFGKKNSDMSTYKTFQARSSRNCRCKYGYTGTARHRVMNLDPWKRAAGRSRKQ